MSRPPKVGATPEPSEVDESELVGSDEDEPDVNPRRKKVGATPKKKVGATPTPSPSISSSSATPESSSSAALVTEATATFSEQLKAQYLKFLASIKNSDKPLEQMCKNYHKQWFFPRTDNTLYVESIQLILPSSIDPILDNEDLFSDVTIHGIITTADITDAPQFVFGDTGQDQPVSEPTRDVMPAFELPNWSAQDVKNNETMQLLAQAFQYFLNIDHADDQNMTQTMLDKVEKLSKKGLHSESLKSQFNALMMLPIFAAQRF